MCCCRNKSAAKTTNFNGTYQLSSRKMKREKMRWSEWLSKMPLPSSMMPQVLLDFLYIFFYWWCSQFIRFVRSLPYYCVLRFSVFFSLTKNGWQLWWFFCAFFVHGRRTPHYTYNRFISVLMADMLVKYVWWCVCIFTMWYILNFKRMMMVMATYLRS